MIEMSYNSSLSSDSPVLLRSVTSLSRKGRDRSEHYRNLKLNTNPISGRAITVKDLNDLSLRESSRQRGGQNQVEPRKHSTLSELISRLTQPTASSSNKQRSKHSSSRPAPKLQISNPILNENTIPTRAATKNDSKSQRQQRSQRSSPRRPSPQQPETRIASAETISTKISRAPSSDDSDATIVGTSPIEESMTEERVIRKTASPTYRSGGKTENAAVIAPSAEDSLRSMSPSSETSTPTKRTSAPSPLPGSTATKPRTTLRNNKSTASSTAPRAASRAPQVSCSSPASSSKKTIITPNSGRSQIQELKGKVTEIERIMIQSRRDRAIIEAQARRIAELELRGLPNNPSNAGSGSGQKSDLKEKNETESESSNPTEELIALRREVSALQKSRDRARAAANSSEVQVSKLTEELIAVQAELSLNQKLMQDGIKSLDRMTEQLDASGASRDNYQQQVEGFSAANSKLERRLVHAKSELRKALRRIDILESHESDLSLSIEEQRMENDELASSLLRIMRQANVAMGTPSDASTEQSKRSSTSEKRHPEINASHQKQNNKSSRQLSAN